MIHAATSYPTLLAVSRLGSADAAGVTGSDPSDVMTPATSAPAPVTARARPLNTCSAGRSPASTCERPGWVSGPRILRTGLILEGHGTLRPTAPRSEVSARGATVGQDPLQGVDRNLLKKMGFRRSLRRTFPRRSTTVGTLAIPALGRDWTTGKS